MENQIKKIEKVENVICNVVSQRYHKGTNFVFNRQDDNTTVLKMTLCPFYTPVVKSIFKAVLSIHPRTLIEVLNEKEIKFQSY